MNLKKFLTCALAAVMIAGNLNVTFAATNPDGVRSSTTDTTEQRLTKRKYISPSKGNAEYAKLRFVKLTSDESYDYYLDRESVRWKRVPYTSSEYMADVWIRMIEKNPDDAEENFGEAAELAFAREQNINYAPSDLEVLMHNRYFLEHYYLRPQRKQIQFLCELEVVGHPQNNAEGREYSYKNWEDLIPGSVESMLYKAILKEIGTSMADANGHQTFADYFEEYTRISIR